MLHTLIDQSRATKTSAKIALEKTQKKAPTPFDRALQQWKVAQGAWMALREAKGLSEAAFDRLVDSRRGARERASRKLASVPARNIVQLAAKAAALWEIMICDFKTPDLATMQCVDPEHMVLLQSISVDAMRIAKDEANQD